MQLLSGKLSRFFILIPLIIALPFFLWVARSQQDLRKRASYSTEICWNRVIQQSGQYQWPDGCKGVKTPDLACTQVLVPLTEDELRQYNEWVASGSAILANCEGFGTPATPTPTCSPRPTCLDATPPCQLMPPRGGSWCPPTSCIPRPACMDANPPCSPTIPLGETLCPPPTASSCINARNGTSCTYMYCPPCPTGMVCTQACYQRSGVCQNNQCISATPTPTPTPTSTGLRSCVGAQDGASCTLMYCPPCPTGMVCTQACYPRLGVCQSGQCMISTRTTSTPTITPTPSNTPTSTPTPTPSIFSVVVSNMPTGISPTASYFIPIINVSEYDGSSGTPEEGFTVQLGIYAQGSSTLAVPAQYAGYSAANNQWQVNMPVPSTNGTYRLHVAVYCSNNGTICDRRYGAGRQIERDMNFSVVTPSPTPTPTPVPQTMNFLVKLGGVTNGDAEGAKISVKFQKRDGTTVQLSQPLTLTHTTTAGVYRASVTLNNPLPNGTEFRLLIKGEKHISTRFCRQVGQTAPCGDNEYITASNSLVYGADLTGIPLPPGDLSQQDGKADATDFEKIMTLMNTSCSSLTAAQKTTADLDYNGCVNVRDAFLMRQTLQTRYDE